MAQAHFDTRNTAKRGEHSLICQRAATRARPDSACEGAYTGYFASKKDADSHVSEDSE